jgi:hypothetical protein
MKTFEVEIEGVFYKYFLLKLKEGQQVKTNTGDYLEGVVMGISQLNDASEIEGYQCSFLLSVFKTNDKYECHIQKQSFCASEIDFNLRFGKNTQVGEIPLSFLNTVNFDSSWLFGREFTQAFLTSVLALPDGEGGTFGDRWEIVTE